MFSDVYIIIAFLSVAVFFLPGRWKYIYTALLTCAGAVYGLSEAVPVLLGGEAGVRSWDEDIFRTFSSVRIDKLSSLFILIISLGAISVISYAGDYIKAYKNVRSVHKSLHYLSFILLFAAMMLVVTCRAAFDFLLAWELMTVSSFLLIMFGAGRREVRRAALNYLVIMHIGFVFLVAGFYSGADSFPGAGFDMLPQYFSNPGTFGVFILLLIGFGIKAGLFPLHIWLPEAHPAAPAHISAFMSGVMIKMGIYGILRVVFSLSVTMMAAGITLFAIGCVTALYGAFLAAVQNDMKRLLAYSSIENIGIITLAIGASAIGYATGNEVFAVFCLGGGLLHVVNHSFFKTILFFGAGNVISAVHTTSLDALGGLSRRMPVTSSFFLLATVAICALPPLSGFVSEFMIYAGFFDAASYGGSGVIAAMCGITALSLTGGIVLLAFTKLYGVTFLGSSRSKAARHAVEVSPVRFAGFIIPALGILAVGLLPSFFSGLLTGVAFSLSDNTAGIEFKIESVIEESLIPISAVGFVFIGVALAVYGLRRWALAGKKVGTSEVWGCGFSAPTHKMQYSGESFSEGLYGISTSLTSNTGKEDGLAEDEIFPGPHSFDLRHKDKISAAFQKWWGMVLGAASKRLMKYNTGKVNHYILYALAFLVLILILSVLKVI